MSFQQFTTIYYRVEYQPWNELNASQFDIAVQLLFHQASM